MKGVVKKIMDHRGYGFIDSEELDEDIFFHYSELHDTNLQELTIGQTVEFDVKDDPRCPQAVEIRKI